MPTITLKLTDPAALAELEESPPLPRRVARGPAGYPADYLAKWDAETKCSTDRRRRERLPPQHGAARDDGRRGPRPGGVNVDAEEERRTIAATLRPGIRAMTKGHRPGASGEDRPRSYSRSFRDVSTHVLAPELSEPAIRRALREGHAYVSHDWMCDPTGFRFEAATGPTTPSCPDGRRGEGFADLATGRALPGLLPDSPAARRPGDRGPQGDTLDVAVKEPGVYRVEGWLTLDGEERPWIYANPIYVREAK